MRLTKRLPAGLVIAGFAVAALAQEDAVFTSGVDVVNLLATVRDSQGRLVNDLTKEDFVLREDGKLQSIRYFERQADLPLTVGLLVDTSLSQRRILEQERSAGSEFFARVLDESKDQAFVLSFDFEVELLQGLTGSKARLERSLQDLELPTGRVYRTAPARPLQWVESKQQFPGGGIPTDPFPRDRSRKRFPRGRRGGGPAAGGGGGAIGTAMYDAVFLAAGEVLHDEAGRKAMVLISDGVDMGSKVKAPEAIEAAQRADVVIYAVHYSDEEGYRMQAGRTASRDGWRPRGEYALETLCNQTGGKLYRLDGETSLAAAFEQIEEELRNQYSIGYTPTNDSDSTEFRRITLSVKDRKHKVSSRAGYYPRRD